MKKIFSKFNREIDKKFQTETTIFIEYGKKFVMKKPLTVEAEEHIKNIYSNYLLLKENFKNFENINVVEAKLIDNTVIFEYAQGEGLDKPISEAIFKKNKKQFFELLKKYEEFIKSLSPIYKTNFRINNKLQAIFGYVQLENVECSNIYDIDLIFDNIFVNKNSNYSLIDYEWVFKHPIPVNYIIFRTICNMFYKYQDFLQDFVSKEEIYDFFNMTKSEKEAYLQMENNFQKYVLGQDYDNVIRNKYMKKQIPLKDLLCKNEHSSLKLILKRLKLLFKK